MKKINYKKFIYYLVVLIILTLSIGYSAFNQELLIDDMVANVRIEADVRVTGLLFNSSENSGLSQYEDYNVNSLLMNVVLPNQNSTVTYKVKVTNFGNQEMGIYQFNNLPNNLEYTVTDYNLQDRICGTNSCTLGATKEFYIMIKYKENGFNQSNIEYNLNLDVDFRVMHTIAYKGITNNNYPTYIIDGGNLNINLVNQVPPKIIAYTNNAKTDKSLYSYANNIFMYNNVTGDLILEYVEKVYLVSLPSNKYFKESAYLKNIKTVTFVDYIDVPSNALKTYDLSEKSDNSIIGWIDKDYNLYIGSEWEIFAKDLSYAFNGMSNATSIEFNNLNTSETTTMHGMFWNASSLNNLDVSNFDTSQVTSTRSMFNGCRSLTSLDLSMFDTSKVIEMRAMFNGCRSLTSLNVSNFNTSQVTTMQNMFQSVDHVTNLNVSSFDTSQVTNMSGMFYSMARLTSLDLSNFDTSQVTDMQNMFSGVSSLTSLDLSSFNTSKVTIMRSMFNGCSSITNLNLSNFNTSNVNDMRAMFYLMSSLSSLDLSNFDTSKVTTMQNMFRGTSLLNLDLSHFDTSQVTAMSGMFYEMRELMSLDISNFDTSQVTDMSFMFQSCNSLTELDLSSFDTSQVTTMNNMFNSMYSLKSMNLNNFVTQKVTDMSHMFHSCTNLISLDIGNFDTSNVTNMQSMFNGCSILTSLDLSSFETAQVTNMNCMFSYMNRLKTLDFGNATFDNVTDTIDIFYNVPTSIYIVAKDDTSRNWIQDKLGVGNGTIVLPSEL